MPTTGCVFHDSDGLCKVHVSGLKPLEGKVASCRGSPPGIHFQVAKSWDSVKGREILARWRSEVKG